MEEIEYQEIEINHELLYSQKFDVKLNLAFSSLPDQSPN